MKPAANAAPCVLRLLATIAPVVLFWVLVVRFALDRANWMDVGALLIAVAQIILCSVLADRRRAQEEMDWLAQKAAEDRAESRITAALAEFEQLKARVAKLQNMAGLT